MVIHRLRGYFGRLDGREIIFKDGLNIIESPNESGKSTIAALIRVMLYGMQRGVRDREGHIADRNRYIPWDAHACEGEITLTPAPGERPVTIRRSTGRGSPMQVFAAEYADTGEPCDTLEAEDTGRALLGLSREAFEKSVFIAQNALAIGKSDALEARIQALASSGDESQSAAQAGELTAKWARELCYRKQGRLDTARLRAERLTARLTELKVLSGRLDAINTERIALKEREAAARRAAEAVEIQDARAALSRIDEARARHEAAIEDEIRLREALRYGDFTPDAQYIWQGDSLLTALGQAEEGIEAAAKALREASGKADTAHEARAALPEIANPQAVSEEARQKRAEAEAELERSRRGGIAPPAIFAAVLLMICAAIAEVTRPMPFLSAAIATGAALALLAGAIWRRRKAHEAAERAGAILGYYGVTATSDIPAAAERFARVIRGDEEAALALREAKGIYERFLYERTRCIAAVTEHLAETGCVWSYEMATDAVLHYSSVEAKVRAAEDAAAVVRDCSAYYEALLAAADTDALRRLADMEPDPCGASGAELLPEILAGLRELDDEAARIEGRFMQAGSPAALEAELFALNADIERYERAHRALLIAGEALGEVGEELSRRLAPALSARTGELFNLLTGGKYEQVQVERGFALSAREKDGTAMRRELMLSAGAMDQLYLSLRIAAGEIASEGRSLPLILDDALACFDDERMGYALDLLKELAETRQVILFTCHARENERLRRK